MENVRGSHNSIPLSKLHSHSFHPSRKNTSIPKGQGQMALGSPLGSLLAPHGRVTFPSSRWELVPITSKANSHICAPVHFLVLVRGLWHSPSPVPGTDTKPLVRGDSYTWRKSGYKPPVRSLFVPRASPQRLPYSLERLTTVSNTSSVHNHRRPTS